MIDKVPPLISPVPAKFIGSLCGRTTYRVKETVLMPFNSNVKSIHILKWQEKNIIVN